MKDRVLLFCKAPKPGFAKSRLAPFLGDCLAAELSRVLTEHVIEELARRFRKIKRPVGLDIWYTGEVCLSYWVKWLVPIVADCYKEQPVSYTREFYFGHSQLLLSLRQQVSGNLGERMRYAFEKSFGKGAKKVVILGVDTPDLDGSLVDDAFSALDFFDVVIGPSLDGGYYLLGLRSLKGDLFKNISWSTPQVLRSTWERAMKYGLSVYILPALQDIDEATDLLILERMAAMSASSLNTRKWNKFLENNRPQYECPPERLSQEYLKELSIVASEERDLSCLLEAVCFRWIGEATQKKHLEANKTNIEKHNPLTEQESLSVYVSFVKPQLVGRLLRVVGKVLPIGEEFSHVKRIRRENYRSEWDEKEDGKRHRTEPRITILLATKETFESLDADSYECLKSFGLSPFLLSIPARAAETKEEYNAFCGIWPVMYRPPAPPRPLPDRNELENIIQFMSICYQVASKRQKQGYLGNCALMVHPLTKKIVAVSFDTSCRSHLQEGGKHFEYCQPFGHAVMNCIEIASWKLSSQKRRQTLQNVSSLYFYSNNIERHSSIESDGRSSESEPDSSENSEKNDSYEDVYMCTGMEVYTTREPCFMCCMALVHARVKRVIYSQANSLFGGLGGGPSGLMLHKLPALNHHFEVLKVDDFDKAWKMTKT
eukprot:jgi/Galph1/1688/GphlegSOOS_G380.1